MHHWIDKMDFKYSWDELVRSDNTGEITLSSYVNSYYYMHNAQNLITKPFVDI